MGDVIPMVKKPKKEKTAGAGDDNVYTQHFSRGSVTLGFNENLEPFFVVVDLDAVDINWLLDRMKQHLLSNCSELEGLVLVPDDTEEKT